MKKQVLNTTITIKKGMKAGYSRLFLLSVFLVACFAMTALADIGAGTFTNPQASQFINGSYILLATNATGQTIASNTTNATFFYTRTSPGSSAETVIGVNTTANLVNVPDVRFTFNTASVQDGLYTFKVAYMNYTGSTVNATVASIAIDNTAPSITRLQHLRSVSIGKQDLDVSCTATDPSDTTLTYELIVRDDKNVVVARSSTQTFTFDRSVFADGSGDWDVACIATTSNPQNGVVNQTVVLHRSSTVAIGVEEGIKSGDPRFQKLIGSPNAKVLLLLGGFVFFVLICGAVYLIFFHSKKRR